MIKRRLNFKTFESTKFQAPNSKTRNPQPATIYLSYCNLEFIKS